MQEESDTLEEQTQENVYHPDLLAIAHRPVRFINVNEDEGHTRTRSGNKTMIYRSLTRT